MSVNAVGGANPVYARGMDSVGGQLSPESLMFYCASQLRALDDDIEARMNQQKSAREVGKYLGEAKAAISAYKDKPRGDITPEEKERILLNLANAWNALPPGHPMRDEIGKEFEKFRLTACYSDGAGDVKAPELPRIGGDKVDLSKYDELQAKRDSSVWGKDDGEDGDVKLNKNQLVKEEFNGFIEHFEAMTNQVSKGAELEMIQLQSMISQRQMAVQLTTNMLNKLNETLMAPIANLK